MVSIDLTTVLGPLGKGGINNARTINYKGDSKMNNTVIAGKVTKLMADGMSLEDALAQALKEASIPTGKVDRVAWISSLESVADVRKAIHHAAAKKSKCREKVEQYNRHAAEEAAGKARLNELLASGGGTIEGAKASGETASGLLKIWLSDREAEISQKLAKIQKVTGAKAMKLQINAQTTEIPKALAKELMDISKEVHDEFISRVGRNDQRCIAVIRKTRYLGTSKKAE